MPVEKPADDDNARRKRAIWRAGHRGIRELDLLLGPYARARVAAMAAADLARFEALLDEADPELLAWLTGERVAPARWLDAAGQGLLEGIAAIGSRMPSMDPRA